MTERQKGLIEHLKQVQFFNEYRGANPFKIKAFDRAQESLGELPGKEFEELLGESRLQEVSGIGKGIALIAQEYKERQTSTEWEESRGDLPLSLLEFLEIRGLGAKKIKALYEELHVSNLRELEYACNENRLVGLKGFGEKTQAKILKEIEIWKQGQVYFLLSEARELAEELESKFKGKKFAAVGDWGAKREILKSLDYLFLEEKKKKELSFLKETRPTSAEAKEKVYRSSDFSHKSGRLVRFWFCAEEDWAVAEVYLTSSDEHWKSLQNAASEKSFKLTERKLFEEAKSSKKSESEQALRVESSEDLYKKLGLSFYPPEARETAATKKALDWVERSQLQGVFHAHTTDSDGSHSLEEMAEACRRHGWHYFGISEHSQTAFYAQGLKETDVKRQSLQILDWNKKHPEMKIFHGIESDILKDGSLDYPEKVLKAFDFVIASIHQRYGMTEMTDRLLKAIQNPHTTMLGHLSGRLLLSREAYTFNKEKVFREAIAKKVVIELNANPHRLDLDWRDCLEACREGLLISINPDAHSVEGFEDVDYGIWMARKAQVKPEQILNTWPLPQMEDFLKTRKSKASL